MDQINADWIPEQPAAGGGGDCNGWAAPCFPLVLSSRLDVVRIVDFVGGRTMDERLKDIGLTSGAEIGVVKNDGHGPLLLRIGETRLALGADVARRIMVAPVGDFG